MMEYYDKLNLAIKNTLEDERLKYHLQYLDEVVKLASIIIENTKDLVVDNYYTNVSLDNSIDIVTNFFSKINVEYASRFLKLLKEKDIYNGKACNIVNFNKIDSPRIDRSEVRDDGSLHIDYSETLADAFNISHEFTHKFSKQKYKDSTIKQFLGESTTLTIEFLLEDYLLESSGYDKDEIKIRKTNRLKETYDNATAVIFEHTLLKLYKKSNGRLNEEILVNYLNSFPKDSRLYESFFHNSKRYLDDIVSKGYLQFSYRQRYVIGVVLASYFHDSITKDESYKDRLFYLIEILGHTDMTSLDDLKALEKLEIPVIEEGNFKVNPNNIEKLSDCYKKEVNDVLEVQKENNRIK